MIALLDQIEPYTNCFFFFPGIYWSHLETWKENGIGNLSSRRKNTKVVLTLRLLWCLVFVINLLNLGIAVGTHCWECLQCFQKCLMDKGRLTFHVSGTISWTEIQALKKEKGNWESACLALLRDCRCSMTICLPFLPPCLDGLCPQTMSQRQPLSLQLLSLGILSPKWEK